MVPLVSVVYDAEKLLVMLLKRHTQPSIIDHCLLIFASMGPFVRDAGEALLRKLCHLVLASRSLTTGSW